MADAQPFTNADPTVVGLPRRPFMFTLDQICALINVEMKALRNSYLYYEGRSIGTRRKDLLSTRNIAPDDQKPEWRVLESEFIRWMKSRGFKYYDRGQYYS